MNVLKTFKNRVTKHYSNFRLNHYRYKTNLSKHIWKLQDQGKDYSINWEIDKVVRSYKPGDKVCRLCLAESDQILFEKSKASLNSRSEIFTQCGHKHRAKIKKA